MSLALKSSQEAPLGVWLTMHLTLLDQNPKRAGKVISRKEKLQGRCEANPRAHPGLDVIHVLLSESRGSSLVQERAAEPRDGCGCTLSGGRVPSSSPAKKNMTARFDRIRPFFQELRCLPEQHSTPEKHNKTLLPETLKKSSI